MSRATRSLTALAASSAVVLAAWSARAQEPAGTTTTTTTTTANPDAPPASKGVGERVGETVDQVGKSIRKGAHDASESVRDQYARARSGIHAMGVQSRVYSRLHWDKALNGADLDVSVDREGVATLKGAVADARARARAVELARETVGINSVLDQMVIRAGTPGASPAPAPAP